MEECLSSLGKNLSGMMRGGKPMNIQEACETLEGLLERDLKKQILKSKEFNALNKILLEATLKLGYKIKE